MATSNESWCENGGVIGGSKSEGTILVADDDGDLRAMIESVLLAEGYGVIEAHDGSRALEILASAADKGGPLPDAVILDFVMPGFSGIGILRVLPRFERPPPTIIITGFPDPSVNRLAQGLGAFRVLHKPINEDDLRAAVREAVAWGRRAAQSRA
jgi:two-component system OmpR family response regulator